VGRQATRAGRTGQWPLAVTGAAQSSSRGAANPHLQVEGEEAESSVEDQKAHPLLEIQKGESPVEIQGNQGSESPVAIQAAESLATIQDRKPLRVKMERLKHH
jgi:hypothetical protein